MRSIIFASLAVIVSISSTRLAPGGLLALTPGNLVVTSAPDLYETPISIREFTPAGVFVQEITTPFHNVYPGVGIVTHSPMRLSIYYRQFPLGGDFLSTLSFETGAWETIRIGNSTTRESARDLSVFGNYLFQREARVNLRNNNITIFDTGLFQGVSQLNVGLDRKLYAVNDGNPSATIQMLDPTTLETIGVQRTARGETNQRLHINGISASRNGDIFVATYPGAVYHFDSDLNLLNHSTLNIGSFSPTTLNLYDSGLIVLGDRFGRVVVTDTTLASRTVFSFGHDYTYAAMVVPEPAAHVLISMGGAISAICTRRRKRPCRSAAHYGDFGKTTRNSFFTGS